MKKKIKLLNKYLLHFYIVLLLNGCVAIGKPYINGTPENNLTQLKTEECTCNGRTFLVFYTDPADILGSMTNIKDVDQCMERNNKILEIRTRLFEEFPDDVQFFNIRDDERGGTLTLQKFREGSLLITELEKADPSPFTILVNTFELNPELVSYEHIDINDEFVTSQIGVIVEGIPVYSEGTRTVIAKLAIPDKCFD